MSVRKIIARSWLPSPILAFPPTDTDTSCGTSSGLTVVGKSPLITFSRLKGPRPVGHAMGQNSAIVPEALDAPSMPPPLTVAIRSQVSKIQSLHHDTLSALRDLIVHNELPPGTRLTETVLSERFSVSRTPLREALKVLSSEGLVEILPNRGARVVTLTLADIKNLFEVIAALESLAGRLACENISEAAAMREHELIVEALERRDGTLTADLLLQHLRHKFEAIRRYLETVRPAEKPFNLRKTGLCHFPTYLKLFSRTRDNLEYRTK